MALKGFSFTGLVKYVTDMVKGLITFKSLSADGAITSGEGNTKVRLLTSGGDGYLQAGDGASGNNMKLTGLNNVSLQSLDINIANAADFKVKGTSVYSAGNKPTPADISAAPVVHSHNELLGNNYSASGTQIPANFGGGKMKYQMLNTSVGWADALWISSYTGNDVKGSNQLVFGKQRQFVGFRKQDYDASSWGTLYELYGSHRDTGWQQLISVNSLFVSDPLVGRAIMYRIDNGVIYFDVRGILKSATDGSSIGRIPNYTAPTEKHLAATGYGDRGGAAEGKSLIIDADGWIRIKNKGQISQFTVLSGIIPLHM